jgi:hypothetical protein
MPLVRANPDDAPPRTEAQQRARKIDPRYAQGDTVKVAFTRNQAESDLIQNILLEEGIPSITRRTRGFDVPDFLAAGPRDVLVPQSGAEFARELLREADVAETVEPSAQTGFSTRILLAVFGGSLLAAFLAWLLANSGAS